MNPGGPEDPLQRMARWDALRRRAEQGRPATVSPVADLVDALEQVVRRHGGLTLEVTAEQGGESWQVRTTWVDQEVRTSVIRVAGPAGPTPLPATPSTPQPVTPSAPQPPAPSTPQPPAPSAPWPAAPPDPRRTGETAERLADLLRRNPSLLDPP